MNKNRISINCIGDSITEGMGVRGHHGSEYGDSPYPARLKTLLVDNGYDNIEIKNCGHGGERVAEVCARLGVYPCYFNKDITIPADNSPATLGKLIAVDGKVTNTALSVFDKHKNGENVLVHFTQASHDTNPCIIEGEEFILDAGQEETFIKMANPDGKAHTIKKGSFLYTNNNRTADINIIYAAVNDGASMTLERFIDSMKKCSDINGGKCIIIGSHHPIFERWGDLSGSNAEKYEKYKYACYNAFGIRFIDLYEEFYKNAMDYTLKAGYFKDTSEEALEKITNLINQKIVPAEFSYDKNSQGNIHLSEEGYDVIARIVFKRLKLLNYI